MINIDEEILIDEIPDEEIEWDRDIYDVYTEDGIEFTLDSLVNDFYTFCTYMFVRAGFGKPTKSQKLIIDFIANSGDKHIIIGCARGIGKSLISEMYVLWRILSNNDEHILVRSASSKRSRNYTTFLLNLIKSTPLLQHLSPSTSQRKSSELFDIYGAKPSDAPTVLSSSIGGTVTGLRASVCVLDDVEVIGNSSTVVTRETLNGQVMENFNLLAETIDDYGNKVRGKVIVLMTFQSGDSIYVPMIRSGAYDTLIIPAEYPPLEEWYKEFVHPSILEVSMNQPEMIGRAIDERLDDEFLAKRRMLSKTNYELHYMLNPNLTDQLKYPLKLKDFIVYDIDPTDNPIRFIYSSEEKIKIKHRGFTSDYMVSPAWVSDERAEFLYTIMAIDPSGKGTDETGYCVVSLMGGKVFIRDVGGVKGGYDDDSLQSLVAIGMKYKVNQVTVESNFGGGAITKMIEKKFIDNQYPVRFEETRSSNQKELRIIDTLEPLLNQHRIIIDRQTLEKDFEKPTNYSFTYQLSHITKTRGSLTHDDILDAVEMAVSSLVEYMSRGEEKALESYADDRAKKIVQQYMDGLFPSLSKGLSTGYNYGVNY